MLALYHKINYELTLSLIHYYFMMDIKAKAAEILIRISGTRFLLSDDISHAYRARLFAELCIFYKCRCVYHSRQVDTLQKMAKVIEKAIAVRETFKADLCLKVADDIKKMTGKEYLPDELIAYELLPRGHGPDVCFCEQLRYNLLLSRIKNMLRNKYDYWLYDKDFYYARTIREIVEVIYWKPYRLAH